jgi:hypothetical protein
MLSFATSAVRDAGNSEEVLGSCARTHRRHLLSGRTRRGLTFSPHVAGSMVSGPAVSTSAVGQITSGATKPRTLRGPCRYAGRLARQFFDHRPDEDAELKVLQATDPGRDRPGCRKSPARRPGPRRVKNKLSFSGSICVGRPFLRGLTRRKTWTTYVVDPEIMTTAEELWTFPAPPAGPPDPAYAPPVAEVHGYFDLPRWRSARGPCKEVSSSSASTNWGVEHDVTAKQVRKKGQPGSVCRPPRSTSSRPPTPPTPPPSGTTRSR